MVNMFVNVVRDVAQGLGYHCEEEKNCIDFLKIVHELPKNADEIC